MARGTAFADVLDSLLGAASDAAPARPFRAPGIATFSFFPSPPANFAAPVRSSSHGAGTNRPAGDAVTSARFAAAPRTAAPPRPIASEPPRPSRVATHAVRPVPAFTPRQQAALDTLLRLGARIDRHFTGEQLRREFRTLAFQYHPDRHQRSSEHEQARMARLFAQLHDAYDHLRQASAAA